MSSIQHPLDKISEFPVSFEAYNQIDNEYNYNFTINLLVKHIKDLETTVINLQTDIKNINEKLQYETILKLNKS
jgi:hypothetical protein